MAKSVPIVNLGINPNLVINKEKLLISLKLIFPNKSFDKEMYGKKFFYVKNQQFKDFYLNATNFSWWTAATIYPAAEYDHGKASPILKHDVFHLRDRI